MHFVRAFFWGCWGQVSPPVHALQYMGQVSSSPWAPVFSWSLWTGELFRRGLPCPGRRAEREGHSTTASEARDKPLPWNGLRSSSTGPSEPLRCSHQPYMADPQPDFFSGETEARNSTPGSYADSVAEQGMQTRSLACWACAFATIHLPAQGPFCVQSVPQTIEVFELLLILVSLKVEAGKETPS